DAEILLAGKQQRPAAPQTVAYYVVGLPAEKFDATVGHGSQAAFVLPRADHDQLAIQFPASRQCQIDPCVWSKRGDDEIKVLTRLACRRVKIGIDGWVDHRAIAAIALRDAATNRFADRDEMSDPLGRRLVPLSEPGQNPLGDRGRQATDAARA